MVPVDDVDYLEGDLVTLAGWGSYYNVRNELVDRNPTLKLINLRVNTALAFLSVKNAMSLQDRDSTKTQSYDYFDFVLLLRLFNVI